MPDETQAGGLKWDRSEQIALPTRDPGIRGIRWADWIKIKRRIERLKLSQKNISGWYFFMLGIAASAGGTIITNSKAYGLDSVTWTFIAIFSATLLAGIALLVVDRYVIEPNRGAELSELEKDMADIEEMFPQNDPS